MLAPLREGGALAEVAIERIRERVSRRIPVDRRVDACPNSAALGHNTAHFPQRRKRILEELQPELAEDDPELAVGEWEPKRPALDPFDLDAIRYRLRPPRDFEHSCVHVKRDYTPASPDTPPPHPPTAPRP